MPIFLLDDTIRVEVYYESKDCDFEDNICVSFLEVCPDDEKIFLAGETNIYLTSKQARQLAKALSNVANESDSACQGKE
jgi:hypothetical protein